ncbi:hypothetical protein TPHA_0A05400 [Tetrapisispora phaffii CBS 4417]|uniref:Phosphatase PP2A regulatory subunit A/Splicing factor 3B subunit 1-like HEAT repeat domain-containing protein n=1 Tax=Tetrapisispora phaffii (strain ATCC 24235 / CBS 4417 / NBRC 1672 / NRRL Y-8282 / UCD 70-5) TaxID=1071381 RepID=G8BNY6_TETPH|nr:hypothetical protein TPHA_0A05400 [Tetrapisispora phaffii CBS 4417]CCE61614.1 hypothetical protein TPHA_0A05400 [Tetrapisispora phaffii CBS 4417]
MDQFGQSKHQLGADYSISQKIKDDFINNEGSPNDSEDILMKNQKDRSIYAKEDGYHKKRLNISGNDDTKKNEGEQVGDKRRLSEDSTSIDKFKSAANERKRGRKVHSNVQSYEVPNESHLVLQEYKADIEIERPDLRFLKESDKVLFKDVLTTENKFNEEDKDTKLSTAEINERNLINLLLKIKNGNTSVRKVSMRTLSDKAVDFGPKLIFDKILPILLDRSLEDQERNLMIKVIDRVMYQLGDQIRPYAKNILKVISPLLIDEDKITRATGTDIISNLTNAVGFNTMILTIRPDIENEDEYIRNISSRALAIVGKAVGVSQLIPFLHAVCHSKKAWRARHTGSRVIQHLSILMGIGILPYLNELIKAMENGLKDEHINIRMATANALTSLAQQCYPYGIDSFNIVLEPLWKGIRSHKGKILASFLKCLASIIPLMDSDYASYYMREVMRIVQREFSSPDEEMKKAVLLILQKCSQIPSVTTAYLKEEIAPNFFKQFWTRRTALDKQLNKAVTFTTVKLSTKLGGAYTIEHLLKPLKDEAEPFRLMTTHAVERVVSQLGTDDLSDSQENRLIDSLLIAFQEQSNNNKIVIQCFGTVANSLNTRMKPYLAPIVSAFLNSLKNRTPFVRENAAELCKSFIPVIKNCNEVSMLNKLNVILFESLGEVYPEVLGSIIGAMHQICANVPLDILQPPIGQILPTLTPILRNNHKKVQINAIKFVGMVAEMSPESVPPKEWMRICFILLEILRSPNKAIRRSTNNTFGLIAKAIGPTDILATLLDNLKVQERQLRVCTAVAIGIIAKVCGPYTVIPVLMNEYKTPETNVQNGILKAMSFMFEYIGNDARDYIYLMLPLLEDALTDRDLVHRQTASEVIRHMALNCDVHGYEDAFIHLLNLLMPNIYETSPHVIIRILDALESLNVALGPGVFMNYVWAGLFHPAKKVRNAFWKLHNKCYIQKADSLVPYYPRKTLDIEEFDIVL